uniref:ZOT protein n=1 Tax=Dulem virus 51 TaxID=3145762 RepID=A0AAU8AW20_9VIRU
MIYLYSGTPGSGKSYHASKEIYDNLFVNKNVIANFEINRAVARMTFLGYLKYKLHKRFNINFKKYNQYRKSGKFFYVDNSYMTPQFLLRYAQKFHKSRREGQTLVVIDECGVIFNPRSWDGKARMEWIKFFSMHRHYGFDFILISQSDRMIDRQIRCLLEYDVKHRDAKNFGFFGKLFSLFCKNHFFAGITYWYGIKEKVGIEFLLVRNRIFDLYDTFKVFNGEEQKQ